MIGLTYLISSRKTFRIAVSFTSPFSMSASTRFLKSMRASATALFNVNIADAQFASAPTALNSNRLPVKANGEVRLRSVLSMRSSGREGRSSLKAVFPATEKASSSAFSTCSNKSVTVFPRKDEMMAGGASFAPKRCAFVTLMMEALRRPLWSYTAFKVSTMKVAKRRLSIGVLPGA